MRKQKLKGLWIPAEILLNNDLSDKEKIILSMILYLSDETGSCFASNKYIASIVNVTSDRVSKIVSSLKEKGNVDVNLKYKIDTKEIEERQIIPILERTNRYSEKYLEGIDKNNYSGGQKELHPIICKCGCFFTITTFAYIKSATRVENYFGADFLS